MLRNHVRNAAAIAGFGELFGAARVSMDVHGMSDRHLGLPVRTHLELAVALLMCTAIHLSDVWKHVPSRFPSACAHLASALIHEPVRRHLSVLAS